MQILQRYKNFFYLFILLVTFSCASTQTAQYQYVEAGEHIARRDFAGASTVIEGYKEDAYKEKDQVLYYLDVGMLYHFSGEYERSNEALSQAEIAIDELFTRSISKALTSGVLNDNALDYTGEDYEDLYLNVFKALNYIALEDTDAALVEIRKVHIKLNLLEDKYREQIEEYNNSDEAEAEIEAIENRFYNDALARYLGLLLYRFDGDYDASRIESNEIQKAFDEQSHLYDFEIPPLPDISLKEDQAHLSVLAFTGSSPRKLAETFYLDTTPNGIWITSVSQSEEYVKKNVGFNFIFAPGIEAGYHFKFQYPRMDLMGSDVDRIVLLVDGTALQEIPLLEKMEKISQEIFLIKQPFVVGKSIVRTVTKGILKEAGKSATNEALADDAGGAILGLLLGLAMDVAVDATENADLRISQYFPAYAHALDVSLDPGNYDITLEYYSGNNLVFRDYQGNVNLEAGSLNLLESFVFE